MSFDMTAAITATRDLALALGPRPPGSNAPPRATIDLGEVPPEEYEQVVSAMRAVFSDEDARDDGTTALAFTGYLGGVTVRVRTVRPSTRVELAARLERLQVALEQAQLAAMTGEEV